MVRPQHEQSTDGAQGSNNTYAPAECRSRVRSVDAADAVKQMAQIMNNMDPTVVRRMVHAREAAAGVFKAFPEGDRRFASVESDSESEDDIEIEEDNGAEIVDDDFSDADLDNEQCRGLFDFEMDKSPQACLARAKEDYGVDLVAEMDAAALDFFARIRLVNFIRKIIDEGQTADEAVRMIRDIMTRKEGPVFEDNSLLTPTIEGDMVLTVLESGDGADNDDNETKEDLNIALEESLRDSRILP